MYPFNRHYASEMQSDAAGVSIGRAHGAHIHIEGEDAPASSNTAIHAAITASATVPVVTTTGFTNPAYPRNIVATAGGTAGDIKAVQVVVEGTNAAGETITETLPAFTVDTAGSVAGSKAFATVTKVTIPAMDGAGATVAIGFGDKLGIPLLMSLNTIQEVFLNGVKEGTAPTLAMSATVLESNTIDLNSALDGTDVDIFLFA